MAKKIKAVVLGVGAEKGLGAAASRRFAKEGYHVLVAGRTAAKVSKVVETIRAAGSESLTTEFNMALIRGLSALGQYDDALRRVDEVMRWVEIGGHALYMPELLRIKGGILLAMPPRRVEDAEACFTQSLELSRRQGARAWELRTATDLAALRASQGRAVDTDSQR